MLYNAVNPYFGIEQNICNNTTMYGKIFSHSCAVVPSLFLVSVLLIFKVIIVKNTPFK